MIPARLLMMAAVGSRGRGCIPSTRRRSAPDRASARQPLTTSVRLWADIGGHAHGDARRAVDQQVGHPGGQHMGISRCRRSCRRNPPSPCRGRPAGRGDLAHAYFGVAHGRGGSRRRWSRSCPGRPPACSAWKTAGAIRTMVSYTAESPWGGIYRSRRPPPGRTFVRALFQSLLSSFMACSTRR